MAKRKRANDDDDTLMGKQCAFVDDNAIYRR